MPGYGTIRLMDETRTEAVVTALTNSGLLDAGRADEARVVVGAALSGAPAAETPLRRRLAEVAGYVGGALVVAAAVVFLAQEWESLSTFGRVATLASIALVLDGAALAVHVLGRRGFPAGTDQGLRRRLASALMCGGAVAVAFAVGVLVEQASRGFSSAPWTAGALAMTVAALAGYLLAPSALGQLTMVVGAATAAGAAIDTFWSPASEIPFALSMAALGVVWLVLVERGLLVERHSGRVLGCALLLFGAQFPVLGADEEWVGYLTTFLVSATTVAVYVRRRAVPYLVTAVAGLTLAVPEALLDWTDDSLGPVGALLVTGLTLLVTSLLGLRLRQEVGQSAQPG